MLATRALEKVELLLLILFQLAVKRVPEQVDFLDVSQRVEVLEKQEALADELVDYQNALRFQKAYADPGEEELQGALFV